jgi:hypothetical protein
MCIIPLQNMIYENKINSPDHTPQLPLLLLMQHLQNNKIW